MIIFIEDKAENFVYLKNGYGKGYGDCLNIDYCLGLGFGYANGYGYNYHSYGFGFGATYGAIDYDCRGYGNGYYKCFTTT